MTPQPNEPTAEAIEAALVRLSDYTLSVNDPDAIKNHVRALRAENVALKEHHQRDEALIVDRTEEIKHLRAENERLRTQGVDYHKAQADKYKYAAEENVAINAQLRASLSTAVEALSRNLMEIENVWANSLVTPDLRRQVINRALVALNAALAQLRPLPSGQQPAETQEQKIREWAAQYGGVSLNYFVNDDPNGNATRDMWIANEGGLDAARPTWQEAVEVLMEQETQPPAVEVKAEEAWLAKTPYERLTDLVGAAEAKRILGTSAQAEKGGAS